MSEEWREDVRYLKLLQNIRNQRTEVKRDVAMRPHIRQKKVDELDALAKALDSLLTDYPPQYYTQLPLVAEVEGRKAVPKKGD
jgi:hypothetical protein